MTRVSALVTDVRVFAARAVVAGALICVAAPASAARPQPRTVAAWDAYVQMTEARMHRDVQRPRRASDRHAAGEQRGA